MAKATWRNDLLASFAERDAREKACISIINEYTRLANRVATSTIATSTNTSSPNTTSTNNDALTSLHSQLSQIRADLLDSQKLRTHYGNQLKLTTEHLEKLKFSGAANLRELDKIKNERYQLERKLKDKDEEMKVNKKIIENLNDEILTLNIQLDLADQAKGRLMSENEELISRWMKLKGDEADAMNNNSRFS